VKSYPLAGPGRPGRPGEQDVATRSAATVGAPGRAVASIIE
jgi:hypothetical protein